jgi:hypothetical protein
VTLTQLLARGRRVRPQRVVGLDAQHEVHAPLEIQPETQLLGRQDPRHRQVVFLREDRIDTEREEHEKDADNREKFPAKILVHDLCVA